MRVEVKKDNSVNYGSGEVGTHSRNIREVIR